MKLFSGHLYGQFFIKTVRGPLELLIRKERGRVFYSLTHKAPPIICSRRQFQILLNLSTAAVMIDALRVKVTSLQL